jgi:hypothetical protein
MVEVRSSYSYNGSHNLSHIGPRLFTWFINDIPTFVKTKLALYADDTAIYAHSFNGEVANRQVQLHLNMILKYFDEWLITINASKTETILFTRKSTNKIIRKLKVKDKTIAKTPTVKYLGLTLDTRLNFHTHINNQGCQLGDFFTKTREF